MTPTAPQPGDAPQQITADGKFIDTLDETGLIGFVSGDTMVLGVGELGDPDIPGSTSIDGVDVYRVTLNAGGTTTITNLSLTSGDTTEPFTEGEISTEKGLFLLPGGDLLALNRQQEVLGRVDPSLPGLQPLLPQTKDVVSVHRAGGSLLVHVRHASASIDQRLHAYDIAGGTLTQFGSLPSGVVIASETGSGMECVTVTVPISNGPAVSVSPGSKTVTPIFGAPGSDCALASSNPAVKAVACTGTVPSGEMRG